MYRWIMPFLLAMLPVTAAFMPAADITVVHFGDSNTISSFLPAEERVDAVLQDLLSTYYKGQTIACVNTGQGGDYIRQFLDSGRYAKIKQQNKSIDIACVRYGQNDMKHYTPAEFKAHLVEFIGVLQQDYPGIRIFLETGIFIDGKHWYDQTKDDTRSCNTKYEEYWNVTRAVAAELDLPLVDQFQRWQVETAAGLWDLRIRNGEQANDPTHPQHYYNAHANRTGVRLYAMELFRYLRHYFPETLPAAGQKVQPPSKPISPPEAAFSAQVQAYLLNVAECTALARKTAGPPHDGESPSAFLARVRKALGRKMPGPLNTGFSRLKWDKTQKEIITPDGRRVQGTIQEGGSYLFYVEGGLESYLESMP